jgi:hypothetical protein
MFLVLKEYISIIFSLCALVFSAYGTLFLSRKSFKINTFNSIVSINKEFNDYFKSYIDKSNKIEQINKDIEIKNLNKSSQKNSVEIKHLEEMLINVESERDADIENCINLIDIIYFSVFKLNVLNDEFRFNFHKLIKESISHFENSGISWIRTDYKRIFDLIDLWDRIEESKDISINESLLNIKDNIKDFYLNIENICDKLKIYLYLSYIFKLIIFLLVILGLFTFFVIIKVI